MRSLRMIIGLLIAFVLGLGGCAGKPITLNSFPAQEADLKNGRPISAEACGFQLLLFIPISINGRMERAYQELVEKAGREYIGNLKINESWTYGLVGTLYCTSLEATAYPQIAKSN